MSKYHFDTMLHSVALQMKKMIQLGEHHFEESNRFINELESIKLETVATSNDTKEIKEYFTKFSSKLDPQK